MTQDSSHYKVVMVGNSGVGKTALVERISEGIYGDTHVPTVGAQFVSVEMTIDSTKFTMDLWDTAGQEVFRSLVGFYTRDALGAFVLFDITSKTSFIELPKWIEFLKENAPGSKIIIFGNKLDIQSDREVTEEEAAAFAAGNGNIPYFEGSAKTGQNAEDAFSKMAELVLDDKLSQDITEGKSKKGRAWKGVNLKKKSKGNKGCC